VHNQVEAVLEGTDALIATPKRLHMLFLKNWINLTRLQLVVLDDAHLLLKHGHKVALDRLGISLHKCQRLAFTEEFNEKVASLTVNLMPFAKVVEVNGEQ
jgi:ATP-dependent RNA helicase RhlE